MYRHDVSVPHTSHAQRDSQRARQTGRQPGRDGRSQGGCTSVHHSTVYTYVFIPSVFHAIPSLKYTVLHAQVGAAGHTLSLSLSCAGHEGGKTSENTHGRNPYWRTRTQTTQECINTRQTQGGEVDVDVIDVTLTVRRCIAMGNTAPLSRTHTLSQ